MKDTAAPLENPIAPAPPGTLRVVGWNVQHLGSRRPPRTRDQLDALAARMASFGASALLLQEVESEPILSRMTTALGTSWTAYCERRRTNILLYDTTRLGLIEVEVMEGTRDCPYPGSVSRKPVTGLFTISGTEGRRIRLTGVHLHWAKPRVRAAEAAWLAERTAERAERDGGCISLVMGDFNAEPEDEVHRILREQGLLTLLPKRNGAVTQIPFGFHFDHAYAGTSILGAVEGGNSVIIRPELYGDSRRTTLMTYSDHLPVYVDLRAEDAP